MEVEWLHQANCHDEDPDLFMSEVPANIKAAKAICAVCPVKVECLDWAIQNPDNLGVWGGLTESERRKLRRQKTKEGN